MFDPVVFYKCLADDTRLKSLLLVLAEGELCVCELMQALELSQPKVSRHLSLLRESGLLETRRQGQWMFYRLHPSTPAWAKQVLRETELNNRNYLAHSHQLLHAMSVRPERLSCC
jgi:ArsR family transcriptional regulator